MLKFSRYLWIIFIFLLFFSCKKSDTATNSTGKKMSDLQISRDFTWETTRNVTFQISSVQSAVINITSETGDIQYYRGFFNGLTNPFSVTINIPALISQVRVNGIPVTISGNVVAVDLSNFLKNELKYTPHTIPTQGLIAAWHFDENTGTTAYDTVGGHNGAINLASWVTGIRGKALSYDGLTSRVQVPNLGFNPTGNSISFSFWFKLNDIGNSGTFIYQNLKYSVSIDSQGKIFFTVYTPSGYTLNSGTSNRVLDTDWHYVSVTYNGSQMKIYLDALLRTYASTSGNLQTTTADVFIGKQQNTNPFKGIIDEMLVYNRALTDSDILEIYGSTPDPSTGSDNLVSYWKFNENTGSTANDSKGINHGTIINATWGLGFSGSGLTFDGATSVVKVPSKLNLNPVYELTMMCWAKTLNNTTTKIFQKGDYDGHGIGQGNWDGWGAQVRLVGNITQIVNWGGGLPLLNEWYHLAMTYNGQTLKFYVNGQLRNSKAVTGLLYVNNRDLSIGSDDGIQKFFKGSIDEAKFFNRALDQSEIQANYEQTGNLTDQDGDGVPDMQDAYPHDPARAFNNYTPAIGFGTLVFEDLWPSKGDYDFNDLVLDYRFKTITNANNKVLDVDATIVIRAIGAGMKNGFGFQLPGTAVLPADVVVAGCKLKENFITLNTNGIESGQQKITVIVFDNVYKIMTYSGGFGINVEPGQTYQQPDTTHVTISFKPNTYSMTDVGIENFNPFLIVNLERGKEIHLPDGHPTSLVNPVYFKTFNDDSDPATGRYYKTKTNLPWAMKISSGFDYNIERAEITNGYLKFATWAESSGAQYPDWYLNNSGYRNASVIYQVPH